MSAERKISNRDQLLALYATGPTQLGDISREEIGEALNWNLAKVRSVITGLRKQGDIPLFTPEDIHRPKTERHSLKVAETKSGKWRKILPLVLRDFLPVEVEEVTGISKSVVRALTHNPRRLFKAENYNSKEKTHERKVRTLTRIWRMRKENGPREEEKKSIKLAKLLYAEKIFTEDLSFWRLTQEVSAFSDKDWYYNSAVALVMEAYVRARISQIKGDGREMDKFNQLGNSVDKKWFNGVDFNENRQVVRNVLEKASRRLS
jgi:hypothetical protein